MAAVVAIITSIVVANATQTFATPNAAYISYSLAASANSAAITPATNRWVLVGGCCTTSGIQAVGQVSLIHIPSTAFQWAGLESYSGAPSDITSGYSGTAGRHIVYIDASHQVDIQVASADTILVHNATTTPVAGNVTLVW